MAYVAMSDLNSLCSPLDGLSDDGFVIYPNVQEALKQPGAFGYLYADGGEVKMTGPNGPLTVKSTTPFPNAQEALRQPGAFGYIYVENGQYLLSGPRGPLSVKSPYVKNAPPGSSVFSLPPLPTTKFESPAALPPSAGVPTGPASAPSGPSAPEQSYAPAEPAVSPLLLAVGAVGVLGLVGIVVLIRKKKQARAAKKAAAASAQGQVA